MSLSTSSLIKSWMYGWSLDGRFELGSSSFMSGNSSPKYLSSTGINRYFRALCSKLQQTYINYTRQQTNRQTNKQACSSQYFAPLPGLGNNVKWHKFRRREARWNKWYEHLFLSPESSTINLASEMVIWHLKSTVNTKYDYTISTADCRF